MPLCADSARSTTSPWKMLPSQNICLLMKSFAIDPWAQLHWNLNPSLISKRLRRRLMNSWLLQRRRQPNPTKAVSPLFLSSLTRLHLLRLKRLHEPFPLRPSPHPSLQDMMPLEMSSRIPNLRRRRPLTPTASTSISWLSCATSRRVC